MAENKALKENRFNTTTNIPPRHIQKGPYLTPILKKILNKKMKVSDPEVMKLLDSKFSKLPIKKLIMLRYALNAIQGENQAIEGILDRIDGKLKSNGNDKNTHLHLHLTIEEKNARISRLSEFYQE